MMLYRIKMGFQLIFVGFCIIPREISTGNEHIRLLFNIKKNHVVNIKTGTAPSRPFKKIVGFNLRSRYKLRSNIPLRKYTTLRWCLASYYRIDFTFTIAVWSGGPLTPAGIASV